MLTRYNCSLCSLGRIQDFRKRSSRLGTTGGGSGSILPQEIFNLSYLEIGFTAFWSQVCYTLFFNLGAWVGGGRFPPPNPHPSSRSAPGSYPNSASEAKKPDNFSEGWRQHEVDYSCSTSLITDTKVKCWSARKVPRRHSFVKMTFGRVLFNLDIHCWTLNQDPFIVTNPIWCKTDDTCIILPLSQVRLTDEITSLPGSHLLQLPHRVSLQKTSITSW